MACTQGIYPIVKKQNLAKNIYDLTILCPEISSQAEAGQFVHIKADGFFLRRPISICEIDSDKGTIRIVFEIRGKGTKSIAGLNERDCIDIIGPLGNGFSVAPNKKIIAVGGGIGVPPMLEAVKQSSADSAAIIGFRDASAVILNDDFVKASETIVCTDNGTLGFNGFVTQALEEYLKNSSADLICACGPSPMLKGVIKCAEDHGIKCEVSLEERMGCGVGACLVCACRTVKDGKEFLSHVCKDGPVFKSEEVIL